MNKKIFLCSRCHIDWFKSCRNIGEIKIWRRFRPWQITLNSWIKRSLSATYSLTTVILNWFSFDWRSNLMLLTTKRPLLKWTCWRHAASDFAIPNNPTLLVSSSSLIYLIERIHGVTYLRYVVDAQRTAKPFWLGRIYNRCFRIEQMRWNSTGGQRR